MIYEDYEIVQVPPEIPLRVEELLLPANLSSDLEFNPTAIAALAKRMRRYMAPYAGNERRKVCISRRDGKRVRGIEYLGRNFANVVAYETRMRELGYDVVTVSTLAPQEQFALWANTTDIVGVHGAGMMNMIMMPSEGNYTEIAGVPRNPNATGHTPCQNTIIRCAAAAGHRICGIPSGFDQQGRPMIDIERLGEVLLCAMP